MKLNFDWKEVYGYTTTGADDERIFARLQSEDTIQVAFSLCEGIKVITLVGTDEVGHGVSFFDTVSEYADTFEIALIIGGKPFVLNDFSDILSGVDYVSVKDTEEFEFDEIQDFYPELSNKFGLY